MTSDIAASADSVSVETASAGAVRRGGYGRYLGRRALTSLVTLWGITLVSFGLSVLVPVNPETTNLSQQALANPEAVQAFRAKFGLDAPVWEQYLNYVKGLLHGDLGISQQTGRPVSDDLTSYAPATLELVLVATAMSLVLGIMLGVLAAYLRNRWPDHVARAISLIGVSVPTYWLALACSGLLFRQLGWLPGSGRLDPSMSPPPDVTGFYTVDALLAGEWSVFTSAVSHLVLPASVLAVSTLGMILRFTRSSVVDGLGSDAVKAARAKGLSSPRVLVRYAVRLASSQIITVAALSFGFLLAATVYVEQIFSWGGLGQYAYRASTNLDLTAVTGVSLVIAVIFLIVNFLADVISSALDPRILLR